MAALFKITNSPDWELFIYIDYFNKNEHTIFFKTYLIIQNNELA